MKTELAQSQIDAYQENGYTIIENFLDAEELDAFREVVRVAMTDRGDVRIPGHENADPDEYDDNVFLQRVNLWQTCNGVRELILDERIGKICCDLEGIDGVRMWHDHALMKRPWDNATAWHRDDPNWSFHSPHSISIWLALDDATIQNGCLYFLPGTHRLHGYEGAGIPQSMKGLFEVIPEWAKITPVAAELKAGSCTFHNGLIAHAAGPNMTTGWRRAYVCIFMPVGSTFNGVQNILTEAQLAQLEVGDELCDDELNPVIYQS